jgi:uncharacterized protein YbgA (DUF1722 family)/uncharacterized protein YbbK (DUF523 family)
MMPEKIIIGVSSCLLGNPVRHDGSHKKDRYLTDILSGFFEFQSYCPETAIGMSIPRPAIRLVASSKEVRLVDSDTGKIDYTSAMKESASLYCGGLAHLSGYILKSKSPSCGMERVKVYNDKGYPSNSGSGIFAAQLIKANPDLPIEEEGRLHDAAIRENFIERVFAYRRWQEMMSNELTVNGLMKFHQRHKYILLAHNEAIYREIGKLVADTRAETLQDNAKIYIRRFTEAMKHKASRKRHVNVLQHCMGYLKNELEPDDKSELLQLFEKYAVGQVPLIVPITLLKYHFRKNPHDYIQEQYYLNPYPEELMLRNHV